MGNIMQHPEVLIGLVVLVVVVVVMSGSSGSTYVTNGPSAEDIKAKAGAQAMANSSQADARRDIMATMLGYDAQRRNMRTSVLQIRTSSADTRYGIDSAERLGFATLNSQDRAVQSAERIAFRQQDSADQATKETAKTERQNGLLNFFGNIIGGIFSFLVPGARGKK